MGIVFKIRFCSELSLPAPPPAPAVSPEQASDVSRRIGETADQYANYLRADSAAHGIQPPASPESMSAVFPHLVDPTRRTLSPGDEPIEIAGLRLRVSVQDIADSRRQQMVLSIENTLEEPVAYRVQTRPSVGTKPCHQKQDIRHNAIVIAPGATEMRVECVYRSGWELEVDSVETIQLPELGAIYASWMAPIEIGIDARTSRNHRPIAMAKPCDRHHPASVQRAIERGEISWRDLVDFYARHRCTTYTFPNNYRAFKTSGERPLPATTMSY
jgi:hypothetical protein